MQKRLIDFTKGNDILQGTRKHFDYIKSKKGTVET